MQSLIIILPDSVNFEQLDQSWPSFLQAAENMPGSIKESVTVITETLSGTSSIARIYAFLFEDNPSLIQALSSPQGRKSREADSSTQRGKSNHPHRTISRRQPGKFEKISFCFP